MLVILDSILNRISRNRKNGKRTYIFIDEIYLLFKYEYTSRFIYELWKRIRKYGGCATGITQNVEELLNNEKARLMLGNSELIILLNQSPTDRREKVRNSIIPFKNKFPKDTKLYKLMTTKLNEII